MYFLGDSEEEEEEEKKENQEYENFNTNSAQQSSNGGIIQDEQNMNETNVSQEDNPNQMLLNSNVSEGTALYNVDNSLSEKIKSVISQSSNLPSSYIQDLYLSNHNYDNTTSHIRENVSLEQLKKSIENKQIIEESKESNLYTIEVSQQERILQNGNQQYKSMQISHLSESPSTNSALFECNSLEASKLLAESNLASNSVIRSQIINDQSNLLTNYRITDQCIKVNLEQFKDFDENFKQNMTELLSYNHPNFVGKPDLDTKNRIGEYGMQQLKVECQGEEPSEIFEHFLNTRGDKQSFLISTMIGFLISLLSDPNEGYGCQNLIKLFNYFFHQNCSGISLENSTASCQKEHYHFLNAFLYLIAQKKNKIDNLKIITSLVNMNKTDNQFNSSLLCLAITLCNSQIETMKNDQNYSDLFKAYKNKNVLISSTEFKLEEFHQFALVEALRIRLTEYQQNELEHLKLQITPKINNNNISYSIGLIKIDDLHKYLIPQDIVPLFCHEE